MSATGQPAIVFDLDGTLIDSIPQVAAAINATLEEVRRPALPLDTIRGIVGEGAQVTMERALAATGDVSGLDTAVMVDRYLAHYLADPASRTTVFPGVVEVLEQFVAAGMVMGICTNKPGATTRPVLSALKLDRFFIAVVTADDTEHRKPDGRHILATLAAMKADRTQAVFVGDSRTDLAAAHDAGVCAVLVTYGYGDTRAKDLPIAANISRFSDLPAAVEEIIWQKRIRTS